MSILYYTKTKIKVMKADAFIYKPLALKRSESNSLSSNVLQNGLDVTASDFTVGPFAFPNFLEAKFDFIREATIFRGQMLLL
mmetsp:Transcript_5577/g.9809  ORF Transcript_5577/g.9809 Transcript_5577/m.9809 type:complete len:82 (-) Transcript_5577:788-1033(-)